MQRIDKPAPPVDYGWRIKFAWLPKRLADRWIWLESFERRYIGTWPFGEHTTHHFQDRAPGLPGTMVYSMPPFAGVPALEE